MVFSTIFRAVLTVRALDQSNKIVLVIAVACFINTRLLSKLNLLKGPKLAQLVVLPIRNLVCNLKIKTTQPNSLQ